MVGELIAHHFINKIRYRYYAILYHSNHQSRLFEKMLMQNAFLIASPAERHCRKIGAATLMKLGTWATQRNKSLFTANFDLDLEQTLSSRDLESLQHTHWLEGITSQWIGSRCGGA